MTTVPRLGNRVCVAGKKKIFARGIFRVIPQKPNVANSEYISDKGITIIPSGHLETGRERGLRLSILLLAPITERRSLNLLVFQLGEFEQAGSSNHHLAIAPHSVHVVQKINMETRGWPFAPFFRS